MKCPVCKGKGLWRLYDSYVCEWLYHECHACWVEDKCKLNLFWILKFEWEVGK